MNDDDFCRDKVPRKPKRLARSQIPKKPVEMPAGIESLDVQVSCLLPLYMYIMLSVLLMVETSKHPFFISHSVWRIRNRLCRT